MLAILRSLGMFIVDLFKSRRRLEAENLFLRHQLSIALRRAPNAYVECLIGTVRRECLDRLLIFGEAHLRRVLASYAAYYNQVRTQRSGVIVAIPILSGLHHHYVRI
jgi:hypothetical protein